MPSLLRKNWQLAAGFLSVLAIGAVLLSGGFYSHRHAQAVVVPYPHELAQVSFAVAGDVIPHEAVKQAAAAAGPDEQGWADLFSNVSDVFHGADFGFVNMETPVAPDHSHGTKAFLFNAPVALPQALKASGIKIVSFANNHVMDQGWEGFAESRQHLKDIGLIFVGTSDNAAQAWQPQIVEENGIKVGWLGMTRWLNGNRNPEDAGQPHVNFFPYPHDSGGAPGADEATVLAAVKAARAQCDLLVVSIHWGVEYATAPLPQDVDIAHKIMEAGASVIVGAHPHVLQPIETYRTQDGRNTVIFYSLGNFLSNQSRTYVEGLMPDSNGEPRDSLIAQFSAVRKDYGPAGIRVEVGNVGMLPAWQENNRNQIAAGQEKTPVIRPVLIDRELPALQARLDQLSKVDELTKSAGGALSTAQVGTPSKSDEPASTASASPAVPPELTPDEKKEFVELTRQIKLLTDRRAQILARCGDDYVTAPPRLPGKP